MQGERRSLGRLLLQTRLARDGEFVSEEICIQFNQIRDRKGHKRKMSAIGTVKKERDSRPMDRKQDAVQL